MSSPVSPKSRLTGLDSLRGFALLGVLLFNIFSFHAPPLGDISTWKSAGIFDSAGKSLITILVTGKFHTIFTFLFGAGLALQFHRFKERGEAHVKILIRRLSGLLLLGLLHSVLIWNGDILKFYGIFGLLTLPMMAVGAKGVKRGIVIFVTLFYLMVLTTVGVKVVQKQQQTGEPVKTEMLQESTDNVYETGNWIEVTQARIGDLSSSQNITVLIFALFYMPIGILLGALWIKRGYFENTETARAQNRKFSRRMTVTALLLIALWTALKVATGMSENTLMLRASAKCVEMIIQLQLAMTYVVLFQRLSMNEKSHTTALAPLGRMALSNYLGQSLFFTTLFYGYGLGFMGKLSMPMLIAAAVMFYMLQIFLSRWWLSRFAYGPVEWLWRCYTYGKRIPLKAAAA